jgi:hypothetical protein
MLPNGFHLYLYDTQVKPILSHFTALLPLKVIVFIRFVEEI